MSAATMNSDSVSRKPTLPCYCTECPYYTSSQSLQPLETYLSHTDSEPEFRNDVELISTEGAEPSKSVSSPPQYVPQTERSYSSNYVPGNNPSTTSVPRYPPHNPGDREPETSIEGKISSVPTQDRSPSNRAHNRPQPRYPRETGLSYGASESRKHNQDLPPIPIQDINSSNRSPQPQETQGSYSVAKPPDHVEPLLIPSVPTEERNQSNYARIRPQSQQLRETHVSSSVNKPRRIRLEPPSIPPVPIQERSQSQINPQPQETRVSSNANKPDYDEHPTSISAQGQGGQSQDRSADASETNTRPHLMHGTPTQMDTQYVNMLLALDDIPMLHNTCAGFFNWILLAGFILFPGTFTSLKNLGSSGPVEQRLVRAVTSIPLFVFAWLCTGVGATGMLWLWWRWRRNYIWALNKIFLPGAMNSLAGFISTITNVFGAQHGEFSTNSKITIVVTGAATGVLGILTAIYSLWLVKRVRSKHNREVGKERAGKHGEGVVDLSTKKVHV